MSGPDDFDIDRRRFVQGAAAVGTLGTATIAGCLGGGGESGIEVLHGWNAGDGAEAADALEQAFEDETDAGLNFNVIGGGGNQDLDSVALSRLQSGNPPASFANWPGPNMLRYEGALGDVEQDVWEEADLKEAHVDEVVEACEGPDGFSAVPIGSHRMNELFYSVDVLNEAGVDPQTDVQSYDDLIDALDAVESETNAQPYVNGLAPWIVLQFWAVNMLGTQGYDAYTNFINGEGDVSQVQAAFESAQTILENYLNDDAPGIGGDFTEANQRIMADEAGFIHQGNWAAGAYVGEDLTYGEDWDSIPFPGTEGMYGLHFDSFLYPSDNPSPEDAKTFLRFVGSESAHVAFNQHKGSIPTRDTPTDEFSPYLTDTIDDFQSAEQRPPTIAHGLAVPQSVQSDLEGAISNHFADPYDAETVAQRFVEIV